MSEEGWQSFLVADRLSDWVVLHGGPTAVFRVDSHQDAARLAGAVAALPNLEPRTILTIASDSLTVKLTREIWQTEARHVELARAVSAVARELGIVADTAAAQEVQVAVAAKPDSVDLQFWRAVLGYEPMCEDNCIDPLGMGSTVWMQQLSDDKPLRHAMHIDVSVGREHVEKRLRAAVDAGGIIIDESDAPEAWILADKSGNKVCVVAWPDGAKSDSAPTLALESAPASAEQD